MKITVFRSGKGDCLMVEGGQGGRILVDGGLSGTYADHVSRHLGELRDQGESIDLVCVSHVDEDHIAGILRMMDDEYAWRVHELQQRLPDPPRGRAPSAHRPPPVKAVWHNAFSDQVDDNQGDLDELLVATMRAHLLRDQTASPSLTMTERLDGLATSKKQALLLRHRLSQAQLAIPVNEPADGGLLLSRPNGDAVAIGSLQVRIIGPTRAVMEKFRDAWNTWIDDNRTLIAEIREEAQREAERLHADEGATFQQALLRLSDRLGDRDSVTLPNLASIILLVTDEAGSSILLTGDSHPEDILAGLDEAGLLGNDGKVHFDVLKLQHHGSEHNIDEDFSRRITADHYVICSDGSHENPHEQALETLVRARAAGDDPTPFKLWFNASEKLANTQNRKRHMRKVETLVDRLSGELGTTLRARFLRRGTRFSFEP